MPSDKILLMPTCKGIEVIQVGNIIRIEAVSNYSKLHFADGKILVVAKVLRWFEENLPQHVFVRIHRTHLINKNFIHQYIKGDKGRVKLVNGEMIAVSKRKKSAFLQFFCAAA